MATPQQKLAESLEALKALQDRGVAAIRTSDLSRTHRERLLKNGFIQEVMKGWYIPARPGERAGDSTAWYASFWDFCAAYLRARFGEDWCLSPEQSLSLHGGNLTVPRQLLVRTPKGGNKPTTLLHGTSIFDMRLNMPREQDVIEQHGLRLFSLPAALIEASPGFFAQNPTDTRTALATVADASDVVRRLLEGGHSAIAGRLAAAFRNIGRERIADDIVKAMRAAGYEIREQDPFQNRIDLNLPRRELSPYAGRIRLMWQQMRKAVIKQFPPSPGRPNDIDAYLKRVEDVYVTDAYHSLSIEGYRVSVELIERVRRGNWNPNAHEQDRKHADALAARGYWQAFQAVKKSVRAVLQNKNPGTVADEDHGSWYREMFAPSVTAGLIRPESLAGYRDSPVYIRRSMHVPLPHYAVPDAMQVFFEMLEKEARPAVRIVLGHFVFVYIHPYMDGNGRMGRFLMNVMLAADGYPWTVVPLERRDAYMAALEKASVQQNIIPFAQFLGKLVHEGLEGKVIATVPETRT
jgi:Fic/DOC family